MTIQAFLKQTEQRLAEANLECADPKRHARQILQFVSGLSSTDLVTKSDEPIPAEALQKAEAFLSRRLQGEPFQYIAGEEWFWKSRFFVGPGVLIPRRETEHLVETTLALDLSRNAVIAELGAGSGNIGISLLLERPDWVWHGYEQNTESLLYLEKNISALLSEKHQYHLHAGSFFEGLRQLDPLDAIVTNPPYVSERDMAQISKEVGSEPRLALEAGSDGMDVIREVIQVASEKLKSGGYFVTEISVEQSEEITQLLKPNFCEVQVINDYSHRPRVISGRRR